MDFLLSPDPGLVFWSTITFLILFFLLKKYAWTPILDALTFREETIEHSLLAAEKAKAEVEDLVKVREELINSAKNERDELLKETRELKEKILADARSSAHVEADRILMLARNEIQAEKMAAIKELKNQVAELSIDIAKVIIGSELNENNKQKNIIDKYLEDVNFN